jgi:uncharacterized protein (DUF952 family)
MAHIFHITTMADWTASLATSQYASSALKEEGFIHCCEKRQLESVQSRYFAEKKDLVSLIIETSLLTSPLIYDWSPSLEDTFPHIYGPINVGAVIGINKI